MSPQTRTQRETARNLFRQKGLVRMRDLRDLRDAEVGAETVARLVREGAVTRVARGLYHLTDATPDTRRSFAEASAFVPKGVVCLTSALQFHELTLQMPSAVWIAIHRTGWKPKVGYPAIRFVRFSSRALKEGVKRHLIEGIEVPIFEPAKTIVDCFRYRNKIGLDIALEGLREGLRTKRATPDQLWAFARTFRVWSVMRPYVEATVANGAWVSQYRRLGSRSTSRPRPRRGD
ncbi:MAG: type IV toxin-antitoxin system AbiEi family antitoxin domain-containing protein [Nitrococcus sp.]|nr:type IV toxin-antitoxin system AbiEi family antitoxin domain-containing protein [Nitrococcus sp.]